MDGVHPHENGQMKSTTQNNTNLKNGSDDSNDKTDFHPISISSQTTSHTSTSTPIINATNPTTVSHNSSGHHPTVHQTQIVNPEPKSVDISREEIIHTIFGDVGELINDFSCAVESTVLLHGRMYITNRFLCFYSNLFGLEKKIRVPYSHITVVTKENTAMVIPNAISVTTHRKEYLFRSFWDRDECFRLLQELISRHRYNTIDSNASSTSNDTLAASQHGGSRTDSIQPGGVLNHVPSFDSSGSQVPSESSNNKGATSRNPTMKLTNPIGNVSPVPKPSNGSTTNTSTHDDVKSSLATTASTNTASVTVGEPRGGRSGSTEEECDIETNSRSEKGVEKGQDNNTDFASLYLEEVNKSKLKIIIPTQDGLSVSLKEFISLFVEDSAPYSWKNYHESVGDTKLEVSNWHEMSSSLGFGREMKFVKPIPSIKSSTRGVKVQRYRRFGDYGLIICSSTRLEDVPAADTFSVDDMIAVKAINDEKISVDITFEVKFIKSTMFRYVIESNTNGEMTKWLEAFYNKVKTICNQRLIAQSRERSTSDTHSRVRSRSDANVDSLTPKPSSRKGSTTPIPTATIAQIPLDAQHVMYSKSTFDNILDRLGLGGGRIYWSSWFILTITFLFFGYQCYVVAKKLRNVEYQIRQLQQTLDAISKKL